jgi:aromatic-L-amino-acid/L-tryptophan decarboxylase
VVATTGTTGLGAVDPVHEIVPVARRHGVRVHVDAAYGGFFRLTERGRVAFAGIERADSITLDPHKGMFLPYGTGSLVVRDGARLREAHFVGAAYLQDFPPEDELPNFTEYSPELSRDFRGLRVWLPLKLFGIEPFREQLDEKLDLIAYATEELRKIDGIEIVAEPQLTITAFRLVRPGLDEEQLNELNRELLARINAKRRVMLTPTMLDGRFVIRICIVSHRTHRDRVAMAIEDIRASL